MAKKLYVYSTLTASVRYAGGVVGEGGMIVPAADGGILIAGGANVADKRLITPTGAVITPIDSDDLERLRTDPTFKLHEANGFLKVSEHKEDGEKVAAQDMKLRDESAPLTPEDFKDGEEPKVATETPAPKPNRKA